MSESFQRARKPDEKAARRVQILSAAAELLAETRDCQALSLNGLARHAGMAKSNVYRYFASREAVLLAILGEEWLSWHTALLAELAALEEPVEIEALAAIMARSMAPREALCRLISVMPTVLERNADLDSIREFKLAGLELMHALAGAMAEACPERRQEQHLEVLHHLVAYIIGAWPLAHPQEPLRTLLQEPRFAAMDHDFEAELARATALLLRGQGAD